MVLSYDYSSQIRRRQQTNAPPSRAKSMAMAVRRWDTERIAQCSITGVSPEATGRCHRATTRSVSPCGRQGDNQPNNNGTHVPTLLAVLIAIAMRWYDTARIARWRRFVAFIKATKRHHRASTCSDIIKGTSQCSLSFKSFRCRRWCDQAGWLGNLIGV